MNPQPSSRQQQQQQQQQTGSSKSSSLNHYQVVSQAYRVITQYGDMLVVKQSAHLSGSSSSISHHHSLMKHSPEAQHQLPDQHQQQQQTRPVIMTFHDLGLNSELQFAKFCEYEDVKLLLQTFTMIHVNFVGQEFPACGHHHQHSSNNHHQQQQLGGDEASSSHSSSHHSLSSNMHLPDDDRATGAQVSSNGANNTFNMNSNNNNSSSNNNNRYPSMEEMAECIIDVCIQLRVRSFIALAVGAGAHVVGALALIRPDLVDGLFLINPVVANCSITEWLYFKMSAIVGNINGPGGSGDDKPAVSAESDAAETASTTSSNISTSNHHHHQQHHHHHLSFGLRKLLDVAHIHLHKEKQQQQQRQLDDHHKVDVVSDDTVSTGAISDRDRDSISVDQLSTKSVTTSASTGGGRHGGSRLRKLILSRNLKLSAQKHSTSASASMSASPKSSDRKTPEQEANEETSTTGESSAGAPPRPPLGGDQSSKGSTDSIDSQRGVGGKRPPLEYLMYHHFGPSSFQRYRRSSEQHSQVSFNRSSTTAAEETASGARQVAGGSFKHAQVEPSTSSSSVTSSPSHQTMSTTDETATSSAGAAETRLTPTLVGRQVRSGSAALRADLLASISSERQRHSYIQGVYKQYFCQLDANNLWQFAHSFVKRKSLNLRKDCGAAAHAAAAATALGTSIFGLSGGATTADVAATGRDAPGGRPGELAAGASAGSNQSHAAATHATAASGSCKGGSGRQGQTRALVAGTKVKRTFACQTLIMCSSSQLHSERAFKLMALLHPLQATCIKTEHLLVLDERPDKVCQALRLFLQGIGYSMSTYERRLKLSATRGSASSASEDSGGEPAAPATGKV